MLARRSLPIEIADLKLLTWEELGGLCGSR